MSVSGCRGRPTDVYALGACLYTFVFGRIPFNAPNVFKLFQVVQNEPLRFPDRPAVTPLLQDLLLRMLHKAMPPCFNHHPALDTALAQHRVSHVGDTPWDKQNSLAHYAPEAH